MRQSLNLGGPIYRDERRTVVATFGMRNYQFSTDYVLPETGRNFPGQLWSLTFGLNYSHQFDDGRGLTVVTGIGSASDRPFESADELTGNLGVFYRTPTRNGRNQWQFGGIYLYGGSARFPFPALSYGWRPNDGLSIDIGLPFSIVWRPDDRLTVSASYLPLLNINARATYRLDDKNECFAGYEFLNDAFFLSDRPIRNHRFFVFEQRLIAGVRRAVGSNGLVELHGGYAFDRRFGEADGAFDSLRDRVDAAGAPYVGAAFRLTF
jgi:hypothetical protein